MPEFERVPSREMSIANVTEASKRVVLAGTVVGVNSDEGTVSIDDGTGVIDTFFEDEFVISRLSNYKEGDLVTIVGWSREGGLGGEVIRRRKSNLNPELSEKINSKWSELYV